LNFSDSSKHEFEEKDPLVRNLFHKAYLRNIQDRGELSDPCLSPALAQPENVPKSVTLIVPEIDPNRIDMELFIEKMKTKPKFQGIVLQGTFHGWNLLPEFLIGTQRTEQKWNAYPDF
jgi:hypothetical protein